MKTGLIAEFDWKASTAPAVWARSLSAPPILDRTVGGLVPASVRRWRGILPDIDQVPLDQHFVSIHLGGAKRLHRRGEGQAARCDVDHGAYSVVPAGAAFHWNTVGPIDFAHFYFDPKLVNHVVESAFDRDPFYVELQDTLGDADPLVKSLALGLIEELEAGDPQQGYLEDLLHLLLCRVLRLHSNARRSAPLARHVLAPFRLRRSLEFIEAHLGSKIDVGDIAEASGISRFHFSRAFRQTTGNSPYAYLLGRRIAAAKMLLIHSDRPLAEIAAQCGFTSLSQFSRMFRRQISICPSSFRAKR